MKIFKKRGMEGLVTFADTSATLASVLTRRNELQEAEALFSYAMPIMRGKIHKDHPCLVELTEEYELFLEKIKEKTPA